MTAPAPSGWQRVPWPLRVVLVLVALVVLVAVYARSHQQRPATTQASPAVTHSQPAAAVPAEATTVPGQIGDGTWIVGTDIQPGIYRSKGAQPGVFEFCAWSTHAGPSTNSKVIDFGTANADEPIVVEIGSTVKAFETSNCEPWVKVG